MLSPCSAPAWPSSWPGGVPVRLVFRVSGLVCRQLGVANEHVLQCQLQHLIHVSQTQIRPVSPPALRHLAVAPSVSLATSRSAFVNFRVRF